MKKKPENVFIPLTPDELKKLAMGLTPGTMEQVQPKLFSTAELWRIQRSKRAIRCRAGLSLV
jgi:hypothetical protein